MHLASSFSARVSPYRSMPLWRWLMSFLVCMGPGSVLAVDKPSLLGAWRLDDGHVITLAPSADCTWRYRVIQDGRSGRLHPEADHWQAGAGFSDKSPAAVVVTQRSADRLDWTETGAATQAASRVAVREVNVSYSSGDALIAGRLVLPAAAGRHPVVILIHGSERLAAVGQWHDPYMLAAHGIGAFVYDKRGTGDSTGRFSADFRKLADDAAAAAKVLAQRDDVDAERIGFAGFSQGGWVAPLAASRFPATRAVLVAYGAVNSPLDEDRLQCREALRKAGGSDADQAELEPLIEATHLLLVNNLQGDWSDFRKAAKRIKERPWFKNLDAERCIAAGFAGYPAWVVKTFAGKRLPPELDWNYDSTDLLQKSTVPMLWLLPEEDSEAPTALTAASLAALVHSGRPFEVEILAGAEHGMLLFREEAGERINTGYHADYFRRTLDYWTTRFAVGPPSPKP